MTRDKIRTIIISLLLKVLGISLFVFVSIFLFATPPPARRSSTCAWIPGAATTRSAWATWPVPIKAYIQLEFSDIDYDEAQYIKFIIDADKNFDIVLYMKDNDNNTFRVRYQTENDVDTGDYKDDDNDDELAIFLDEDEYVTGYDETFNSFTHSNSLSLDEYINTHWKKREYNGGSAELEKIRIYGDELKLYYIAIDDGDFSDPTWEIDVADENWDSLADFENDGHSLPDLDEHSTTTKNIAFATNIAFLDDCIYITTDFSVFTYINSDFSAASGYFSYGGLPPVYWNQPYFGWNQPYFGWNQPYFGGYQQPYNPYRYQQSYFQPLFYGNDFGSSPFGYPGYIWAGQPPDGWRSPPFIPGYYQPTSGLSNDFGGPYFWSKQFNNPYGVGYQQPSYYPYGYGETFNPYGYQQAYPYSSLTYEQLLEYRSSF